MNKQTRRFRQVAETSLSSTFGIKASVFSSSQSSSRLSLKVSTHNHAPISKPVGSRSTCRPCYSYLFRRCQPGGVFISRYQGGCLLSARSIFSKAVNRLLNDLLVMTNEPAGNHIITSDIHSDGHLVCFVFVICLNTSNSNCSLSSAQCPPVEMAHMAFQVLVPMVSSPKAQ